MDLNLSTSSLKLGRIRSQEKRQPKTCGFRTVLASFRSRLVCNLHSLAFARQRSCYRCRWCCAYRESTTHSVQGKACEDFFASNDFIFLTSEREEGTTTHTPHSAGIIQIASDWKSLHDFVNKELWHVPKIWSQTKSLHGGYRFRSDGFPPQALNSLELLAAQGWICELHEESSDRGLHVQRGRERSWCAASIQNRGEWEWWGGYWPLRRWMWLGKNRILFLLTLDWICNLLRIGQIHHEWNCYSRAAPPRHGH